MRKRRAAEKEVSNLRERDEESLRERNGEPSGREMRNLEGKG